MSVELMELELRPCALVDGVGFVWSGGEWRSPPTLPGDVSSAFTVKLETEGVSMSEDEWMEYFPEADLSSLPRSSKGDPAGDA